MSKICLAGSGWGAVAAFKSLKKDFKTIDVNSNDVDLLAIMREADNVVNSFSRNYDVIICAGYMPIITCKDLSKNEFLNIHYSLLPKYRGMHSTVWAILNGEECLGLTIHKVNENIDDGDIIYQHSMRYEDHTATDVMVYCNKHIENNLSKVITSYLDNNITPKKQEKSFASWVCKRNLTDCEIDFSQNISYLRRFFKALSSPYPRPYFLLKGSKLTVEKYKFISNDVIMTNGRVVNIDEEGLWIQINGGYLICSLVVDENDQKFDFRNIKIGTRL